MLAGLEAQVTELEEQRAALLATIVRCTPQQLRFRPHAASWSALEVIDHVAKVEASVLEQVTKSLPQGSPLSLRDRAGAAFIVTLFRSRRRVKVPSSAAAMLPAATESLESVLQSWSATQRSWAALLETIVPAQMKRGLFRHPVGGWMSAEVTLRFLGTHVLHHRYQLERLEEAFDDGAALSA